MEGRAEQTDVDTRRGRSRLHGLAVLAILSAMFVAMWTSTSHDAPTFDEPGHIGAGLGYAELHDLRWLPDHPPLSRLLAGLALRLGGVQAPRSGPVFEARESYELGRTVLYRSGHDPGSVLALGRLPLMLLTILAGLVVYAFASDLFGRGGGLIALAVYALDPNVLAHGRLVTTDGAVSAFLLCTVWLLWRGRTRRSRWMVLAGIAYGFALSSKFTAIPLGPVFLVLVMAPVLRGRMRSLDRAVVTRATFRAGAFFVLAFTVVWVVYLGIDPHQRFVPPGPYKATHDAATGPLPPIINALPLPAQYRFGLVFNVRTDQDKRPAFLAGRHYSGGSLLFYPAGLALKTPVTHLALWVAGSVLLIRRRGWRLTLAVLGPAMFFMAFAMISHTNIGLRHVLPVPLFLAVAAGGTGLCLGRPLGRALAAAGLILSALSVGHQHPSYLSYTTDLAGGRDHAYRYFVDSSVDWGQDLQRLASYVRERGLESPLWLSYFGTVDPRDYGISSLDLRNADPADVHGLVAVSVTQYNSSPHAFAWLKEGSPATTIGGSILVFEVP